MNIGLSEKSRAAMAQELNEVLANEFVLYIKTLKFHWNVVGSDFGALHAFFEKQYDQLLIMVDDVAERVRALGYMAIGTCVEIAKLATITEQPGKNPKDSAMLALLCADHEIIICQLRKGIEKAQKLGDEGTANFCAELMEKHEKMAWMLRVFSGK